MDSGELKGFSLICSDVVVEPKQSDGRFEMFVVKQVWEFLVVCY